MKALLDTNILLRIFNEGDAAQESIRQGMIRLIDDGLTVCICTQGLVEVWCSATKPKTGNGFGMEPARARQLVDRLAATFTLLPDPPDLFNYWVELCTRHEVRGRQVYDARLAAIMLATGVTKLVTLNGIDFRRYPHVEIIKPTD